jgi:hypothetical protein
MLGSEVILELDQSLNGKVTILYRDMRKVSYE